MLQMRMAFRVRPDRERVFQWMDMLDLETEKRFSDEFRTRSVSDLGAEAYAHLAWHAMCWDADHPDTLMYFLPRIFEDAAADLLGMRTGPLPMTIGPPIAVDFEMLASVLSKQDWASWKPKQVAALSNAWFTTLREASRSGISGDGTPVIALMLFSGIGPNDIFTTLQGWPAGEALPVRADLLLAWSGDGALSTPFADWSEIWGQEGVSPEHAAAVVRWLLEPGLPEAFESAFWSCRAGYKQPERFSAAEAAAQLFLDRVQC